MPEVNKKEQNEKFYQLILELLETQKLIIEKLNTLLEQKGTKKLSASEAWDKM